MPTERRSLTLDGLALTLLISAPPAILSEIKSTHQAYRNLPPPPAQVERFFDVERAMSLFEPETPEYNFLNNIHSELGATYSNQIAQYRTELAERRREIDIQGWKKLAGLAVISPLFTWACHRFVFNPPRIRRNNNSNNNYYNKT